MTLSNEPEFSPWIIQPSTEEKIFKENIFDYGLSEEVLSKEEGLLPDEKNLDENPTLLPGVESVENQIDEWNLVRLQMKIPYRSLLKILH